MLKTELIPGLILLGLAPAVWTLGRMAYRRPGQLLAVTVTIVAVCLIALAVAYTR